MQHDILCNDAAGHRTHDHRLFLRRHLTTDQPQDVVMWAVWDGGFAELWAWPWDAAGLAFAQRWCDEHGAIWHHSRYPVQPGDLAAHVPPAT